MLSDRFSAKKIQELPKLIRKYLVVLRMTWEEYFVWRINFVLWRFRQILQLITLYFFWSVALSGQEDFLGYTQGAMLTYILGTQIVRSIILSSRSVDVAGEIHDGKLTNYLIRPVSYFGFWFTRDLSDKFLNIFFAIVEVGALVLLFKPPLVFQENALFLALALVSAGLALTLYFLFSFVISLLAFWVREVWASRFLTFIIIDFFAGGFFPVDILPAPLFAAISLTPFPYLIFFPIKIYLGQVALSQIFVGFAVVVFWILTSMAALSWVWSRGLRTYTAEGR